MKHYVKQLIDEVLGQYKASEAISDFPNYDIMIPKAEFGDLATNIAMILAKQLKQNPQTIATDIAEKLKKLDSSKDSSLDLTVQGGFININFNTNYRANAVYQLTQEIKIDQIGKDSSGVAKKVIFEYSSPNTNKPLHIGHTRNDTYGRACINLLKAVGYDVVACEIINDRGIHIMKSMLMYMKFGEGKTPQSENIKPDHFVGKYYVMFSDENSKQKSDTGASDDQTPLEQEAQELLQKWEAGDSNVRGLWKQMNDWWYEGVKQTYQSEGSYFDEVDYESAIYDKGRDLVLSGVDQGVFTKEADGSVSVDLTESNLDKKYLLRKDGTTIYITQDLYLWHLRNERHHPDMAIVTTAIEQAYHFAVLKKLFELLKYPWATTFRHLPYEYVFLGQSKMSSRAGKSISADDLLVMIKDKVRTAMANLEKIKGTATNDTLVQQVAFGAIKYGYLKYEPNTRIYFDIDQTIALEGNTGPYIQYAYARIQSILKKAGTTKMIIPDKLSEPAEISLIKTLLQYSETVVIDAARENKPNLLCNYLHELAAAFNSFYNSIPVLTTEDEILKNQRLTLLSATAQVLKNGLTLLGIEAPEEM